MNDWPKAAPADDNDRLTILRMMWLVAGWGVALAVFQPEPLPPPRDWGTSQPADFIQQCLFVACVAICFPMPGLVAARLLRRQPLSQGAWLGLALSLGIWLLIPPAIKTGSSSSSFLCLNIAESLSSVWLTLTAVLSGQLRLANLRRPTGFSERWGWWVLLGWLPLGLWWLWDLYAEAFLSGWTIKELINAVVHPFFAVGPTVITTGVPAPVSAPQP